MKVRSSFLVMPWPGICQSCKINPGWGEAVGSLDAFVGYGISRLLRPYLKELLQENQLISSNLLPGAPQTGQRSGAEPAWV